MKILIIGSGGREHALVWKVFQSKKVTKIYCAPGNAGIAGLAECVPIKAEDINGLKKFALDTKIDLTIVGPEIPLVTGIVDGFRAAGLRIFGPSKAASRLEGSKLYAKQIMQKYNVPTAVYSEFTDERSAIKYIQNTEFPIVLKADGLAAGKGVIVAQDFEDAEEAIHRILVKKEFGGSSAKMIIEECLIGEEASILAFSDGNSFQIMQSAQDHKRVFDDDRGPNTGGMGAYSPAPVVTDKILKEVEEKVFKPMLDGMKKEGAPFVGVLYAGIMVTKEGPKVLEFNARFGDPETQPILMRLKTDIIDIIEHILSGTLDKVNIEWEDKAAVCVVLASGGYPGDYEKGKIIHGLNKAAAMKDVFVFHAGTAHKDGHMVTAGGRVLGVTAMGGTIKSALDLAYEAVKHITFDGMHFRSDIGKKAIK